MKSALYVLAIISITTIIIYVVKQNQNAKLNDEANTQEQDKQNFSFADLFSFFTNSNDETNDEEVNESEETEVVDNGSSNEDETDEGIS